MGRGKCRRLNLPVIPPEKKRRKKKPFPPPPPYWMLLLLLSPKPLRLLPLLCGLTIRGLGKRKKNGFPMAAILESRWRKGQQTRVLSPPRLFSTSNCPFSFQSDVSGAGAPRSSLSRYLKNKILHNFFWLLCVMCVCVLESRRATYFYSEI